MARADILNTLYAKQVSALDFRWDNLFAPPLLSLVSAYDIERMRQIATSNKLASQPDEKYRLINDILVRRGFKKIASGTNRIAYKYLDDQSFCLKVALDATGMKDNPAEYKNQFLLKPYVTKIFESSPCGAVALVERVEPIVTREEYMHIADDVFNFIVEKIIGRYVVSDIGTNYYQNIGIRTGFGPVLLDFPYVYELDGNKIFCNHIDPVLGSYCLGEIDYDDGFNNILCTKCGKRYLAKELAKKVEDRQIIIKGKGEKKAMRIVLKRGDNVVDVIETDNESNVIKKPESNNDGPHIRIKGMKKFEERVKRAEDREDRRKEAVAIARDKASKNVEKSISAAVNSLEVDSKKGVQETPTETYIPVDAAKLAEERDPNYFDKCRFARSVQTESQAAKTVEIEFACKTIENEAVNRIAEKLKDNIASEILNKSPNADEPQQEKDSDTKKVEKEPEKEQVINEVLGTHKDTIIPDDLAKKSSWENPVEVSNIIIDFEEPVEEDNVTESY